jgi:hypothetical protein
MIVHELISDAARHAFGTRNSEPAAGAELPLQGKVQKPEHAAQALGEGPSLAPEIEPLVM